jgi:hypothetical protein
MSSLPRFFGDDLIFFLPPGFQLMIIFGNRIGSIPLVHTNGIRNFWGKIAYGKFGWSSLIAGTLSRVTGATLYRFLGSC